jgi:hypothetical protein
MWMEEDADIQTGVLAETDHYIVWEAIEPDGEKTYHLELGRVTLHFFVEEWEEFRELAALLKDG